MTDVEENIPAGETLPEGSQRRQLPWCCLRHSNFVNGFSSAIQNQGSPVGLISSVGSAPRAFCPILAFAPSANLQPPSVIKGGGLVLQAVILAGGLGTRMHEETRRLPKPMVSIGGKPVLWHILQILSANGISDFIICGGYRVDVIKDYFGNYAVRNMDFEVSLGSGAGYPKLRLFSKVPNWNVTILDTGPETPTGGRLAQARAYLNEEPVVCVYGDTLANVDLRGVLALHQKIGLPATVTVTSPPGRFGVVGVNERGLVTEFREKPRTSDLVSIGFFVFEKEALELLEPQTDLEQTLLPDLVSRDWLAASVHSGFWHPMDTLRELQELNSMWDRGEAPWLELPKRKPD